MFVILEGRSCYHGQRMTGYWSVTESRGVTALNTEKLQTVPTGPKYSTYAVGVHCVQECYCRTLPGHCMAQEQSGTVQYLKISNFEWHWQLGTSLATTIIFSKSLTIKQSEFISHCFHCLFCLEASDPETPRAKYSVLFIIPLVPFEQVVPAF